MKDEQWTEMIDEMIVLSRLYRSLGHNEAEPEGRSLFSPRFWALGSLVRDGPQTMSSLARRMNISKPNLTVIAAKLVEDGLVVRRPDPKDGRAAHLMATEQGVKAFAEAKAAVRLTVRERMERLNDEETEALLGAVRQLTQILLKLERSL